MSQIQLIHNILTWERALEIEEERRSQHRTEPYVNYLAAPLPSPVRPATPAARFELDEKSRKAMLCQSNLNCQPAA